MNDTTILETMRRESDGLSFRVSRSNSDHFIVTVETSPIPYYSAVVTTLHLSREAYEEFLDMGCQITGNALYIARQDSDSEVT